jgi:hypothetical protein
MSTAARTLAYPAAAENIADRLVTLSGNVVSEQRIA